MVDNNSRDTVVVGMVVELLPLLLLLVMVELPLEVTVGRLLVDTEVLLQQQLPATVVLQPVDMEDNPLVAMVVKLPEVMVEQQLLLPQVTAVLLPQVTAVLLPQVTAVLLPQVTAVLLQEDMEVLRQAGMVDRLQAGMLPLHEEDPREDMVDQLGADESPHSLDLEEDIKQREKAG